jgi:hypothetical protein
MLFTMPYFFLFNDRARLWFCRNKCLALQARLVFIFRPI